MLASRFTDGDATQLNKQILAAQLMLVVKSGDIAELRRLAECKETNMNVTDNVSD